jgi:hypothetical protein
MALQIIGTPERNDDDIPWVNEYIDLGGEPDTASIVTKIVKTPKGFMVLTDEFKGFLFVKSAIYGFLAEALDTWKSNATINYPLFAVAGSNGKINLAVDTELEPTVWIEETKNKAWSQKVKKKKGNGSTPAKSNPFLPTPPPTDIRTRKNSTQSSTEADLTIGH